MELLKFAAKISGSGFSYQHGIVASGVVTVSNQAFLVTTSGAGGGVTSLALSDGDTASIISSSGNSGAAIGTVYGEMTLIWSDNSDVALIACSTGSSIGYRPFYTNGQVGQVAQTISTGGALRAVTSVTMSGATYVYSYASGASGLDVFSFDIAQGDISRISESQIGAPKSADIVGLTTLINEHGRFLLSLSSTSNEVTTFRINEATGHLTKQSTFGAYDGLGIDNPVAIETVRMEGRDFAIVASRNTGSLSVLEVDSAGNLSAIDHVLDTQNTRFGAVNSLKVAEANGRVFVLAGGGEDGVSLFTLSVEGKLLYEQSIVDDLNSTLDNVSSIAAGQVGTELQVFVTSQSEAGVTQFDIDLSTLNTPLTGGEGADNLSGNALADIISGQGGNDQLSGGGGDDILIDGPGSDILTGGAGRDRFVLVQDESQDTITDFQAGLDMIDLSMIMMLYDVSQVSVTPQENGAIVRFREEIIVVESDGGHSLSWRDLFLTELEGIYRPPLELVPSKLTIIGSASSDSFSGRDGADLITGEQGDDILHGNGGNDHLDGGLGFDKLFGGSGADVILGRGGNDLIDGGSQADRIYAGDGDDDVAGGDGRDLVHLGAGNDIFRDNAQSDNWGSDTVYAENGNDVILGSGGDDRFFGGKGNDLIFGGAGDDLIDGGAQYDTIHAGDGADTVHGGDGRDTVYLGAGNDRYTDSIQWTDYGRDLIWGGGGDDTIFAGGADDKIWGEAGEDHLDGGNGHDTVLGGEGNDILLGGFGNDMLDGGPGSDIIFGGNGDDVLQGGWANDVLYGGFGDDTVFGGTGSDQAYLGEGDDLFVDSLQTGSIGNDVVDGNEGNDTFIGGGGADTLTGGAGEDRFVFGFGNEHDTITDFTVGVDRLEFQIHGLKQSDLTITSVDDGTMISYLDASVFLVGVAYDEFNPGIIHL